MGIEASLIALVAGKLIDLACTEIGHVWNVDENLGSLLTNCQIVQRKLNLLRDKLPKEWITWVREVTMLFYDVDDIIDGITMKNNQNINQLQQQQQRLQGHVQDLVCSSRILSTARGVLNRSFSGRRTPQNVSHHHPEPQGKNQVRKIIISELDKWKLPHKINNLLERLELINKQVDGLLQVAGSNRPDSHIQYYSQGPLARKREEDMTFIIKEYLLNPNFTGKGVCIVGMSGIGKSTLARYIQYDTTINEQFAPVNWASVGSDFNSPADLVFEGHVADGHPVAKQRARRKLLILDDLWNVQNMAWDNYQSNYGSETIFLITTRNPKVAIVTKTTAYFIERLSDEDCNELIMAELPQALSDHQYRRRIFHLARKCAGLPLMAYWLNLEIQTRYQEEEEAEAAISHLEESDFWELKEFRDEVFPALRFHNPPMPPEMGKFIAYLCLFPEGHYFKRDELTLLWMAEGFITPEKWTALDLKSAGRHFDDILSRSMFYLSLCSSEDKTTTYKIHEFTRRFAQDIATNMCYHIKESDDISYLPTHKIRHLALGCQTLLPYNTFIEEYYKSLRTFLLLSGKGINNITDVPESLFQKLHRLRVLSLSHSHITILPRAIGNLKHLRYLDVSSTPIQSLPNATCKLFGLHVIKLKNCPKLLSLPSDIGNLVNLVHLEVDMARLSSSPRCIGLLTKLQTLEAFTVYNAEGYRITELKNMNNLRGSIKIKNLENVSNASEAENANLYLKSYLKSLELHWSRQISAMPEPLVTNILGMLQPHNNLTELQLTNYSGDAFPSWISSPSCRLQVIHLYNCLHITELSPFWKLQHLKSLSINTACSLVQLGREFFGDLEQRRFPKLVSLELQNMTRLTRWGKLEPGDMPSLRKLKISGCPVLSNLPNFRFFTSLKVEIIPCPSLRVPRFPPSVFVRIIR